MPKAREAAEKALELDPTVAEAHIALTTIRMAYDGDWSGAGRAFIRALALKPGLQRAHSAYSVFLSVMERHDEAIAEAQRSQELDPLSPMTNESVGASYWYAGRYEEAIEKLQETIEMYPGHGLPYQYLGFTYSRTGMYDGALAALEKADTLMGGKDARNMAAIAYNYALSGRRDQALKILDELHGLEKREYVPPMWMALVYTGLRQKEKALHRLERAYEVRDGDMPFLRYFSLEPLNDDLRNDYRYQNLLRRLNYPE